MTPKADRDLHLDLDADPDVESVDSGADLDADVNAITQNKVDKGKAKSIDLPNGLNVCYHLYRSITG